MFSQSCPPWHAFPSSEHSSMSAGEGGEGESVGWFAEACAVVGGGGVLGPVAYPGTSCRRLRW